MRNDAVAFSFGYTVVEAKKRKDGAREPRALDLFEIPLTPSPANPDTRVLSMKSMKPLQAITFTID